MRVAVIILGVAFLVWLLSVKHASKIGDFIIKYLVNPIKGLFE